MRKSASSSFQGISRKADFFQWKKVGVFPASLQGIIIVALFMVTAIQAYFMYRKTGKVYTYYPPSTSILLAPLYEELIFRGILLQEFARRFPLFKAGFLVSLLFGVWHIKNLFFLPLPHLSWQIIYAAVFLGPILSFVTLRTKTVWPAVILHYVNNIIAPLTAVILARL